MTITIDLPPELETSLIAEAKAQNLPLPRYLEHLLRDHLSVKTDALSAAERAQAWRESVKDLPRTPPLSDEAISRALLYGDRG